LAQQIATPIKLDAAPGDEARVTRRPKLGTRNSELAALAVLIAFTLIYHGSGIFGGPIHYERDTTLFYFPFTDWFAEQLRAGRLPLWTPTSFAGYPLVADGEIGPLYPLNLLALPFLAIGPAFVGLRAVHTGLAAVLCYGLLRVLGASPPGSLVAGLVFGFGSFLVGQLQHENMIRSAVWLPGELLLLEKALRSHGWARQRWLVGTGALLGIACLGVHIQAIAMSLVALALYVVYRLATGPFRGARPERLLLLVWAPALVAGVAALLAAVQWLPLLELGRTSFRGPGLRYDLATTYSLPPHNLPTLLFPYFFRGADGLWWSLWAPWETLPYVGIAPLALGVIGLLQVHHRPVWYFGALAIFGFWTALSYYAPLNLHELLWQVPGFSSLRAPGRFTYLFVLGMAGLAAFGLDALVALGRRAEGGRWERASASFRPPPSAPRLCGAFGLALLALALALPVAFYVLRERLLADPGWGQQAAEVRYLSLRQQSVDLQPYQVYEGLLFSLDASQPKTAFALGLLAAVGFLLLACWRSPRQARLWAIGLGGLAALDLLVFALDYHPRAPLEQLNALPPVARYVAQHNDAEHVFAEPVLASLEPNRLVLARLWELNGYSSLQSQRHWEYISSVDRQDNALLDIWNGRYYVTPAQRGDVVVVAGTAFRPYELLLNGGAGNPTGRERFRIDPFRSGEVRVLAALSNAISLPQGEVVAEVTLVGQDSQTVRLPLRAGIELSEHAIDRADVGPISAHARAHAVYGLPDRAPTGAPFTSNIYYATFGLPSPVSVQEVQVSYLAADGYLRLWGLGLVEPGTNRVRSLFADDKAKYEHPPLYLDGEAVVHRNTAAFPRAFVVPEALARRGRGEETAISRMALRPFDPRRQAIIEEGPFDDVPLAAAPLADQGSDAAPPAAEIFDRGPENVLVKANGPGLLVLTDAYHRGWRAYLDGRQVPVYLANYVARGVGLPQGEHTVEFVFDPLSWRLGLAISLAGLSLVAGVLSSKLWAREPHRDR
jgi:hypothetical protein